MYFDLGPSRSLQNISKNFGLFLSNFQKTRTFPYIAVQKNVPNQIFINNLLLLSINLYGKTQKDVVLSSNVLAGQ